ncbi:hypothetical protein Tco_1362388 [Tanacetum coccineum]
MDVVPMDDIAIDVESLATKYPIERCDGSTQTGTRKVYKVTTSEVEECLEESSQKVAPKVGAAAVASPAKVLDLDIHSSSEADPSKSSPPPVSVAPIVLPFLCSDDS